MKQQLGMSRLARTAAGSRYLVNVIDFDVDRVHCYGEVVGVRGTDSKHAGERTFALRDVTIVDVWKTNTLLKQLFEQAEAAVERGDLPQFATKAQAKAQRKQRRRMVKRARNAGREMMRGNSDPMFRLIDEALNGVTTANKEDNCEGCDKVATGEVDGFRACDDCQEVLAKK